MEQENPPVLNMDEMVDYVQDKLIQKGFMVEREALHLIFDFEMDYMVENGFAFDSNEGSE